MFFILKFYITSLSVIIKCVQKVPMFFILKRKQKDFYITIHNYKVCVCVCAKDSNYFYTKKKKKDITSLSVIISCLQNFSMFLY